MSPHPTLWHKTCGWSRVMPLHLPRIGGSKPPLTIPLCQFVSDKVQPSNEEPGRP